MPKGKLMAKEKVYKLAKEFKVSSEALMQVLKGMGVPVKSHMSSVDENLREEIQKTFEKHRTQIKKQYARKKKKIEQKKEDILTQAKAPAIEAQAKEAAAEEKKEQRQDASKNSDRPAGNRDDRGGQDRGQRKRAPREGGQDNRQRGGGRPQGQGQNQGQGQGQGQQGQGQGQGQRPSHSRGYVARPDGETRGPKGKGAPAGAPAAGGAAPVAAPVPPKEGAAEYQKKHGAKKHKKKKGRHKDKAKVNEIEISANVKATLAKIGSGSAKKKYKKDVAEDVEATSEERPILNVSEFVTANELANMMHVKPAEVITKCLGLGLFVTINQRLDFDTIEMVVDEFGYEAKLMAEYSKEDDENEVDESNLEKFPRSPVVTVMGHVDHGKTSVLDYIRKTNVIAGEAGGITQHIAAYEVSTKHGKVTFLDTPGHEAFTEMRARGSQVTDVVVLVVAADSAVMPQTKEAIDHAKAADVPLVVAINKIDLPTANIDKIKGELATYGVVVEDYGGQVSCVQISAKTGEGMDKLLEILALETEILELTAPKEGVCAGVVIESELDKGKGAVATVLIQKGTLKKGDAFVTGIHSGRVRDLFNERGASVTNAGPSQPVVVLGLSGTPQAGDSFKVMPDEKEAREISARRRLAQKERELRKISSVSLEHLYDAIKEGQMQTLNLIIKGDVDGSVEALAASLEKLTTDEIKVNVIHKSVGGVKEADIMLAAASNAIIVGFHLNPNPKIRELAKSSGVDIRTYRIIYEAVDEIHDAMEGMLKPELKEQNVASIEIRQVFKVSKLGLIAGCMVLEGKVIRGAKARLTRDDIEIAEVIIDTLKRHKDDVREVSKGFECGLTLNSNIEFKEGDRLEVFEEVEVARKLSKAKKDK